MPNTTQNVSLILDLDGTTFECQVINAEFAMPGTGTGTTTETACPDGVVVEPGSLEDGSLTGEVFTDLLDTGLTWILASAKQADSVMNYTVVYHADQPATNNIQFSGLCKVATFALPFEKPGLSKHSLDLTISTCAISRYTPA